MQPTLAQLVTTADLLVDLGLAEQAANVLAFVLAHPDVHTTTYEHAEALFDDLETRICPRVIWDARAYAKTATLEQVLANLQDTSPLP